MDGASSVNTGWREADRSMSSGRPVARESAPPRTPLAAASVPAPPRVSRESAPNQATLAAWNELVRHTEGTDVTQLSVWATIRALAGYTPTYLFAYRGNTLVAGALLLRRRLLGFLSIGYLPYGPVIHPEAPDRPAVIAAMVEELNAFARHQGLLFIQPPEHAHDVSEALLARGYRPSKAGVAPAGSYRLDLTPPLEEIRAGFSKRLKSWTNRWESKGVRVRRGDERDLPLLLSLMARTGERQGFRPPPLAYVQTLYRELGQLGNAALFVGEVNGVPVSADVVTVCGGMVRGRLGGFNGDGETGKLSVPAAVRWEIIKWAKERGYHYLDFGGLPERMLTDMIDRGIHTSDEWPSAQRSKLQFNGTPFRYPTPVELVRPPVLRLAYDWGTSHPSGMRVVQTVKELLRASARPTRS